MSDWTAPLARAFETIYDKINAAEANTQYRGAYDILRKNVIDFNNSIATDPEPEKAMEKWDKAKEGYQRQASAMIKNSDAREAFDKAFSEIDMQQYETISHLQTGARIEKTVDQALTSSDSIAGDSSLGTEERKQKLRDLWNPIAQAGMRNRDTVDKYLLQKNTEIDMSALENSVTKAAAVVGWDIAIDSMDAPEIAQMFPGLAQANLDTVKQKLVRSSTIDRAEYNRKVKGNNAGVESDIIDKLSAGDIRGAEQVLNAAKPSNKNGFMDEEGGTSGAEKWKQWYSSIQTYARDQRADKKAAETDNSIFDDLFARSADSTIDPEVVLREAQGDVTRHEINSVQYNKVKSALSPRVKARAQEYEAPFSEGAKDANLPPDQKKRYQTAIGVWRSWVAEHLTDGDKELQDARDRLLAEVNSKVAMDNVQLLFQGMVPSPLPQAHDISRTRGAPSPVVPKTTGDISQFVKDHAAALQGKSWFILGGVRYTRQTDGSWKQ